MPDISEQSVDSDSDIVITSKDKRNRINEPDLKRKQMAKDRQKASAEKQ